jgi:hypothetical protein
LAFAYTASAAENPGLPEFTGHASAKIMWQQRLHVRHGGVVRFEFVTAKVLNGNDPNGTAQLFESQLRAAGSEEYEADTSDGVFVSA